MKRGIFVVLLILFAGIVNADYLNVNLTRNITALNQNFIGHVEFDIKEPISKESTIDFNVNGKKISKKIFDIISPSEYITTPISYIKKSNSISASSKEITYSGFASNLGVGIDLSSGGRTQEDIGEIKEFKFSIEGVSSSGSNPSAKIDIGNNNKYDYIYLGEKTGEEELDSSYLKDNSPDELRGLRGNNQDVFCQGINVKPSKEYDVLLKAQKINSGGIIKAAILDEPNYFECGTELGKVPCCTIDGTTEDLSCSGGKINREISQEGIYYACISIFEQETDLDKIYYKLGVDTDSSKVNGYYNTQESGVDYYIKLKRAIYNDKLNTVANINFNVEILNEYLSECNDCLLIPLNITSIYPGKLVLKNLLLTFEDLRSGVSTITSFVDTEYIPESMKFSKLVLIDLSKIKELNTPAEIGTYKISAEIGNLKSKDVQFITDKGPEVFIRLSNLNPSVGENVFLNATIKSEKQIINYTWVIGNVIKSGNGISYTFLKNGPIDIIFEAADKDGVIGRDSIKLNIGGSSNLNQVDLALQSINNIRNLINSGNSQFKDTISLLNITDSIGNLEKNILVLNKSIETILKSDKTEDKKNEEIAKINSQIQSYYEQVPTNIEVTVSTFPSEVYNIDDIPNKIASNSALKKGILIAQEKVVVNGEARLILITYINNQESFILIKKVIEKGEGDIYEVLPLGLTKKEILTDGYKLIQNDIIKFSDVNSFIYLAEGDFITALDTKTIIVPPGLEEISDNNNEGEIEKITFYLSSQQYLGN